MSKQMIGNISKYYQSIISRLNAPSPENSIFSLHALNKDLVTGFGTIVYNVQQKGFYGIIDEDGNKYFPANCKQFSRLLQDRTTIQFSLRLHPEVSNLYGWGTTVHVVAIQLLE